MVSPFIFNLTDLIMSLRQFTSKREIIMKDDDLQNKQKTKGRCEKSVDMADSRHVTYAHFLYIYTYFSHIKLIIIEVVGLVHAETCH